MRSIDEFVTKVSDAILNPLVILLFAAAFLVFLWGVFQFVYAGEDSKDREDGKRHLLYGVIGMTIMVAAYAIMEIIRATAGRLFGN